MIVRQDVLSGTNKSELTRMVKCVGGNGCDPNGLGRSIYVKFLCNPARKTGTNIDDSIVRADIERFATDREIGLAH